MKTELLGGFLDYQRKWLRDGSRFKIGLWARQTGKDFTCAAEAVLDCIETPRCHWLILACGERQAVESLEKAKEFVRSLEERVEGCRFKVEGLGEAPEDRSAELIWDAGGTEARTDIRLSASTLSPYRNLVKRESATEIRFTNGSRITALPAKAGTIRGVFGEFDFDGVRVS